MKRILTALLLMAATITGLAQTGTNDTGGISLTLPSWLNSSNLNLALYGTYDTTTKSGGAGVAIAAKINENLVSFARIDEWKNQIFVVSGGLQLQLPVNLGKWQITPFTFSSIATRINSKNSGEPIGIFGAGGIVKWPQPKSWFIPHGVVGDYEHWTGGGYNNNQIRGGFWWPLSF